MTGFELGKRHDMEHILLYSQRLMEGMLQVMQWSM